MCHTVPPRLNKFGVAFKQNGFELPPGTVLPESEVYGNQILTNDEPKAIVGAGFPFMLRTGFNLQLSEANTVAGATTNNMALGFNSTEFGIISGGAVETGLGGLGWWIDAPNGTIGSVELDMNFNPLFKVTVANAIAPQVGYGLGLPVNAFGLKQVVAGVAAGAPGGAPALRNEAATTTNGLFQWGNNTNPGIEIRGTTNPTTGFGLNYTVGYLTGTAGVNGNANGTAVNAGQNPSTIYGAVAYYIEGIDTNVTVGYSTENSLVAASNAAVVVPPAATQTLVSAAIFPGEALSATISYNSFGGVNAGGYTSVLTVAPEYMITSQIYVGGRYSTLTGATAATPNASVITLGVGYKLLQNVQTYINYTSRDNGGTGATANNWNQLMAGVDFVM
jgi:hypothetical protein